VVVALLYPQYAFLRAIAAIVAGISSPAYPVASISTLWHFTSPFMIALEAMVVQIVLYFSLAMYVLGSHSLSLSLTLTHSYSHSHMHISLELTMKHSYLDRVLPSDVNGVSSSWLYPLHWLKRQVVTLCKRNSAVVIEVCSCIEPTTT
jgi:hypothetical protein